MPKQKRLINQSERNGHPQLFIQEKRTMGITDFAARLSLPKPRSRDRQTSKRLQFLEKDHITSKYPPRPALFQLG